MTGQCARSHGGSRDVTGVPAGGRRGEFCAAPPGGQTRRTPAARPPLKAKT